MTMQYTTLGRTGLRVSVAGLGCGGNSRLGLGTGRSDEEAIGLVKEALDLGVNFFDTAEAYGTEEVLGRALKGTARENVVVSSKSRIIDADGNLLPPATIVSNLESSLRRLDMPYLDVFHLHAVQPRHYDHALREVVPRLLERRDKGWFRHLGITETPPRDPDQVTLRRALDDDCWEVMMLAYHLMNQGPRRTVFPVSSRRKVGTLLMFVVRNIFSRPGVLADTLKDLASRGEVPPTLAASDPPLGFLVHDDGASSLTDAAYRFARHEPGADVVLFGTGSAAHLRANVASILSPPLPAGDVERLHTLFAALRGVGLVFPDRERPR